MYVCHFFRFQGDSVFTFRFLVERLRVVTFSHFGGFQPPAVGGGSVKGMPSVL